MKYLLILLLSLNAQAEVLKCRQHFIKRNGKEVIKQEMVLLKPGDSACTKFDNDHACCMKVFNKNGIHAISNVCVNRKDTKIDSVLETDENAIQIADSGHKYLVNMSQFDGYVYGSACGLGGSK